MSDCEKHESKPRLFITFDLRDSLKMYIVRLDIIKSSIKIGITITSDTCSKLLHFCEFLLLFYSYTYI